MGSASVALLIREGFGGGRWWFSSRYGRSINCLSGLSINWLSDYHSCSIVYGILLSATTDRALARTPLEQGILGGQAALGMFHLQGLSGLSERSVRAPAERVCLARGGLGNEVTFLQVFSHNRTTCYGVCHEIKAHRLGCWRHTLHIGTIQPPPVLLPEG